jgi:hypothetical protein
MKRIVSFVLVSLVSALFSATALADSVVATYNCELEDGKTTEDLHAANSKWLKWVREKVNPNITSQVGNAIVGNQDMFLFVDTYPDLATWAATQTALDESGELDDLFEGISECSENRLWKLEPTQ